MVWKQGQSIPNFHFKGKISPFCEHLSHNNDQLTSEESIIFWTPPPVTVIFYPQGVYFFSQMPKEHYS